MPSGQHSSLCQPANGGKAVGGVSHKVAHSKSVKLKFVICLLLKLRHTLYAQKHADTQKVDLSQRIITLSAVFYNSGGSSYIIEKYKAAETGGISKL